MDDVLWLYVGWLDGTVSVFLNSYCYNKLLIGCQWHPMFALFACCLPIQQRVQLQFSEQNCKIMDDVLWLYVGWLDGTVSVFLNSYCYNKLLIGCQWHPMFALFACCLPIQQRVQLQFSKQNCKIMDDVLWLYVGWLDDTVSVFLNSYCINKLLIGCQWHPMFALFACCLPVQQRVQLQFSEQNCKVIDDVLCV